MSGSLFDQLYDAEWRGVPFHMPDVREETGRRTIRTLFPGRDDTQYEDMGALDGAIRVTGLIIGDDYIRRATRMREAFREPGPGLLVHPWLGDLEVVLAEPAEISFSAKEIRVARFSASFEPFFERAPEKLDTLGLLFALLDDVRESARRLMRWVLAPIRLAIAVIRAVGSMATELVGFFRTGQSTVRGLSGLRGQMESAFAPLLAVGGLPANAALADAFSAAIQAPGAVLRVAGTRPLAAAVGSYSTAAPATAVDAALASRFLLRVVDRVRGSQAAPAPIRLAVCALLVTDAVQLGVQASFASRQEALATRDTLDAALASLAGDAAAAAMDDPNGAGQVWRGVASLRAGLARDMSERFGRLPAVQLLTLATATPTWLVAQHLVGDRPRDVPAQYLDLVARNRRAGGGGIGAPGRLPEGDLEVLV